MSTELLNSFFAEDGDAHARRKLLDAIRSQRASGGTTVVRDFTFNRFKVILDFEKQRASLHDDLTVGPLGEYEISLDDFERALRLKKWLYSTNRG